MATDSSLVQFNGLPAGKVRVSASGLEFQGNLTWDEWIKVGRSLSGYLRSVHWWIGDWLNYGERRYGERYSQALSETGFSYDTLAQDKWVASRFPPEARRPVLSFSHHREVAKLPEPERHAWLEAAERRGLTSRELHEVVRSTLQGPEATVQEAPHPNGRANEVPEVAAEVVRLVFPLETEVVELLVEEPGTVARVLWAVSQALRARMVSAVPEDGHAWEVDGTLTLRVRATLRPEPVGYVECIRWERDQEKDGSASR